MEEGTRRGVAGWARLAIAAGLAAALAAVACGGGPAAPGNTVDAGTWGGDHALLTVAPGNATIEFDCAHGSIDSMIPVGPDGRFDVPGVYVREHGGPIRKGEADDRHAGRYSGSTDGQRMSLSITVGDLNLQLGPYALVLGGAARIVKCL